MGGSIRRSAVAGTWYPGSAAEIVAEVDRYLGAVTPVAVPGRLLGLLSPHAGLCYSGPVAAHAYAPLRGREDLTAVLIGPSHYMSFHGVGVWARGAFETPLGSVPIDEDLAAALVAASRLVVDDAAPHRREHSLEMQLPFLQRLVPGLRLVPCLMGSQGREEVEALAGALAEALRGREAVLVASSDLSHYHPAPVANRLDAQVREEVERFDPEGLQALLESFHGHACGGGPLVAVMKAARGLGADRGTVLRYADSGDAGEGDKSHVVGYLAAAFSATSSGAAA